MGNPVRSFASPRLEEPFPLRDRLPVAPQGPDSRNDYARYSTIGLEFAAIVGILGWLGHRLDAWLLGPDAFPVFLLVGIFAGLFGGIYRMNRMLSGPRRKDGGPPPDAPEDRE